MVNDLRNFNNKKKKNKTIFLAICGQLTLKQCVRFFFSYIFIIVYFTKQYGRDKLLSYQHAIKIK